MRGPQIMGGLLKTIPPSKEGESSSNLIPFHFIPGGEGGRGHFHLKFKAHLYIFLREMGNTKS